MLKPKHILPSMIYFLIYLPVVSLNKTYNSLYKAYLQKRCAYY
jgi:hypothetical protein